MYGRPEDDVYHDGRSCCSTVKLVMFGKLRWITIPTCILLILVTGFTIGYLVRMAVAPTGNTNSLSAVDYDPKTVATLQSLLSSEDIETRLTTIAEQKHLAGTGANHLVLEYLKKQADASGLKVRTLQYDNVLLQYPNATEANSVKQMDAGQPRFSALNNGSYFNAYSASGSFAGKPLLVNYGTVADFEQITKLLPCSEISGTSQFVAIAKYGRVFRGTIARNAANWKPCNNLQSPIGALLLYMDPADYAKNASQIWPNGWYVRGIDVAVGTLKDDFLMPGDPLTPGLPSLEGVYREEEVSLPLLKMLVQPITFDDARTLLSDMAGQVMTNWTGGLNIEYHLGPGYDGSKSNWTVEVNVMVNQSASRQTVTDLVTVVRGAVEPDRYVIVGGHYDAWTCGANDAGGAAAILSSLIAALGQLVGRGWRPRRSIVLVHWDSEEYGLIGSEEFVEQFGTEIEKRTVAYLNMDTVVNGVYSFATRGHPLLTDAVYSATQGLKFPNDTASRSVYQVWQNRTRPGVGGLPSVEPTGSGSDHWSFWRQYGVPYLYPQFDPDGSSGVPFYHTLLDNMDTVSTYVDPGFVFHDALAKILADLVLRYSDSAIVPYSFDKFAVSLQNHFNSTVTEYFNVLDAETQTYVKSVSSSIGVFADVSRNFTQNVASLKSGATSDLALRIVNDKLMLVWQSFVTQYNVNYREIPSLLYDVDKLDDYGTAYFPGVLRAVRELQSDDASLKQSGRVNVKRELSALLIAFRQATSVLSSQSFFEW